MPTEKRRRIDGATSFGFSPFLRSMSRMIPRQKHLTRSPPPNSSLFQDSSRYEKGEREEVEQESFISSSDEEEEEEEEEETVVQFDIAFSDPKESHFHGVKFLLNTYLDSKPWDITGFVDLILEQTTVGSVVKTDFEGGNDNYDTDDDDNNDDSVLAVISVLNLGRYATHKSVKDVTEYVLGVCMDHAVRVKLDLLLKEDVKDVGLLVCERACNFPYDALVPLYTGLFDEIGWATEDEPTHELRESFRFKFYLRITQIYKNKNPIGGSHRQRRKVASKLKKNHSNQSKTGSFEDDSIVYIKVEDEIFHKLSTINFTFDLHNGHRVPPELKNFKKMGLVMVVDSNKVPDFKRDLKHLIES